MELAITREQRSTRIWALHLLCFLQPVSCLLFSITAPHPWYFSLPWLLVVVSSVVADVYSPAERRQPPPLMPDWPFDSVLFVLAAIQLLNVALVVRMVALFGFWRVDTLVGFYLVGINSAYSGIVVAHELIHRPQRYRQQLGRLLLCTVLYEHFFTEHIRGHHVRLGKNEDPAMARFGEGFGAFFLRTVPAQFRSAWRLEAKRLGDEAMQWWDPRMLRSRVVRGLALEWGVAFAILVGLGPGAFAIFVLQALLAVRLLEAINFIEHWGLISSAAHVQSVDSWDSDSWFTLYTLVGLSRHTDHHAHASRPYQQLRYCDESPKLPYGYLGTVVLLNRRRRFEALMTEELKRRRLGPFATVNRQAAGDSEPVN